MTISVVIAIAFGVTGGHLIYNALEMVGIFGEDLGSDPRARLIYAESHRWVHLFAAACALALGWFLSRRNWWMFFISLLAIFACGAYGIQNMYGFSVKNRVGVALAKVDDKASAHRQYENARKDLQDQIGWLQRMSTQEDGRERRRLLVEVDAKRKELSALKPPVVTADNAMADASAAGFAKLTTASAEWWTFALPLALAILMFLGESFSFVVVGHMVSGIVALIAVYLSTRTRPDKSSEEGRPIGRPDHRTGDLDGSGGSEDTTVQPRPLDTTRPDNAVLNKADEVSSPTAGQPEDAAVSSGQPRVLLSDPTTGQKRHARDLVQEFLLANPDKAHSSMRALSRYTGVPRSTVHTIMQELNGQAAVGLGPFRSKPAQELRGMRALKGGGLLALPN